MNQLSSDPHFSQCLNHGLRVLTKRCAMSGFGSIGTAFSELMSGEFSLSLLAKTLQIASSAECTYIKCVVNSQRNMATRKSKPYKNRGLLNWHILACSLHSSTRNATRARTWEATKICRAKVEDCGLHSCTVSWATSCRIESSTFRSIAFRMSRVSGMGPRWTLNLVPAHVHAIGCPIFTTSGTSPASASVCRKITSSHVTRLINFSAASWASLPPSSRICDCAT